MDRNIPSHWIISRTGVALRKESVDRNVNLRVLDGSKSSSLSARRAWIEMTVRNVSIDSLGCRSPQGERG